MNVRSICLAILYEGETTGYEIRKLSTDGEYAYFVEASYGSIYPALSRLEEEKLVTSRIEQQDGKPARKVYSITEAGRRAFIDTLFNNIGDDVFRCEFLMFARFANELPADLVERRISERISMLGEHIVSLEELGAKRTTNTERWVLGVGLASLNQHRDYLIKHRHELIGMARPIPASAAE
ncbi:MAG: PadR family transcriptional regulator [Cucumibacter sp.]